MAINQYNIVRTATDYVASDKDYVISEGGANVTLPAPSAGATVAVASYQGSTFSILPSGSEQVEFQSSKSFGETEAHFFVSDGTDWFSVSNRDLLI